MKPHLQPTRQLNSDSPNPWNDKHRQRRTQPSTSAAAARRTRRSAYPDTTGAELESVEQRNVSTSRSLHMPFPDTPEGTAYQLVRLSRVITVTSNNPSSSRAAGQIRMPPP